VKKTDDMNLIDISNCRLINQQIVGSKFKQAKELVGWMGAMQAQDYAMAKWAIGIRLPNSTQKEIESAMDDGQIIRTHLLRPTWHFVSSEDIYWMLELTSPQIKAAIKSSDRNLELTDDIFRKSNAVLERSLRNNNHLSREDIISKLKESGIDTGKNRVSHLLLRAEIDGVICSGKAKAEKQTYALLAERVLKPKTLTRDIALAELARKYSNSHCPATLHDFIWWSGLTVTESRQALEMIKSDLISETIGNQTYWFTNSFSASSQDKKVIHFIPAFDEFIISYKERKASLPYEDHKKSVSDNGIFWPVIALDGQVIGTWKREIKREKVIVRHSLFALHDPAMQDRMKKALIPYGLFLGKPTELID